LPLAEAQDAIVISEVFEHLHNALAVAQHLVAHLKPGGRLWENYLVKEPETADLAAAQEQRAAVFEHLRAACRLAAGGDPDRSPSETRCWIKR
jgi:2-polyprenyl-3-methyl-5-hydroxy-6-metoxy-1,4-benzoquinol methylase